MWRPENLSMDEFSILQTKKSFCSVELLKFNDMENYSTCENWISFDFRVLQPLFRKREELIAIENSYVSTNILLFHI